MGAFTNWIVLGALCSTIVLTVFGSVSAESVEGSVRGDASTKATSDPGSASYYWKVWNGALPEQPAKDDHSDLLAVLTGAFTGPPIGCTFSFRGGGLEPSTLAARAGTPIRIENLDAFTHELVVRALPGFTPLESGPGKARVVPVPAGGPWEVGDRLYGHIDGYLHSMRELVACATVTPNGGFRFDGVPPGPYSLRVLRGPEQVAMRRVTVAAGRTLQVDPLTLTSSGGK
ncbi:MAG: carboxypeptidase-like regulatory domain-containing protein [Polyangiales bacterium]|jgi:hypothetical protein